MDQTGKADVDQADAGTAALSRLGEALKRLALALLLASSACATGRMSVPAEPCRNAFVALPREDWVVTWDRYDVSTHAIDGRQVPVYSAAPGARELILTQQEHDAQVALEAFWTTAHRKVLSTAGRQEEHTAAMLYLRGASPGSATLRLVLRTGKTRDLSVVVK